ncbi:MAG: hypothetical protein WA869_03760 [Alloacidobacterium sp.]|jgi:hypothetical protein
MYKERSNPRYRENYRARKIAPPELGAGLVSYDSIEIQPNNIPTPSINV